LLALSIPASASAQERDLDEIVRNRAIGNDKGYAAFKMCHYATAATV
jgi:hypothetical protein